MEGLGIKGLARRANLCSKAKLADILAAKLASIAKCLDVENWKDAPEWLFRTFRSDLDEFRLTTEAWLAALEAEIDPQNTIMLHCAKGSEQACGWLSFTEDPG